MRRSLFALLVLAACADSPPAVAPPSPAPTSTALASAAAQPAAPPAPNALTADTQLTASEGTTFYAPAGWTVTVRGVATIIEAPEGDTRVVIVDARVKDADAAVAAARAAYKPDLKLPDKSIAPQAAEDGWADSKDYIYQTSPNEKRDIDVFVQRAGDVWNAVIYDVFKPTGEKRGAAVSLIYDRILPKGYVRESFAGKKANTLDAARVAQLTAFTEKAMKELGIPGVALGIVQDGKVVYADGLGVRELGKPERPNADTPHAPDIEDHPAHVAMNSDYAIIPLRPAGAAWSNIHDMLAYVSMELAEGVLPNGKRLVSRDALLERRKPQVATGQDETYGMALMVNTKYVTPIVHHGGDLEGFHSDMIWLPEYNVGAVILTNGNPGWALRDVFRRKLLEVLFDGKSEADSSIVSRGKSFFAYRAGERKLDTVPADAAEVGKLAKRYQNDALGGLAVSQSKGVTTFDFGEWKSDVASRKNPDGTVSFVTISPGVDWLEFVVRNDTKRGLVVRDEQHEYLFTEK